MVKFKLQATYACSRCGTEAAGSVDVERDKRDNLFYRDHAMPEGWESVRWDHYDEHDSAVCPECIKKRNEF